MRDKLAALDAGRQRVGNLHIERSSIHRREVNSATHPFSGRAPVASDVSGNLVALDRRGLPARHAILEGGVHDRVRDRVDHAPIE